MQTAVDSVTNWYQRQGFFYSSLSEKGPKAASFKLHPNPSSGFVTIETDIAEAAVLTIYDVSGRIMIQQPIKGNTLLNIGEYAKGLYFVEVAHTSARSLRKLVVE
ncbi:MAG: T9SS type A sorting domain-containing protein [Bacteroidia bacterium]|nr:T9SS type A sorting domain-containing protein [Bacteroidia bacterium]